MDELFGHASASPCHGPKLVTLLGSEEDLW
jgi:hypothetical protein